MILTLLSLSLSVVLAQNSESSNKPQTSQTNPVSATAVSEKKLSYQGQVFEKGTLKKLSDVNVFFLPAKLKATTDKNGEFKIENVPESTGQIIINVTGYKKFVKEYEFVESKNNLILYVEKENYKYFETTVSDSRSKQDDSQKTLKQSDFLQMPGSGGDPVKAVQNLPGVNRVAGGSSKVVIQGSEPEDTSYNIDGHNVPLVFHFGGLNSIVTPEAVESVDYLSAGYGSRYSRALGGHVGLNVRNPKLDRQHGIAFMDIYNVGGLVEGPLSEDSGYLVSGRYSYVGYVLKEAAKNNKDFNLTVAPVFYDINGQYYKKLNARDEFRLFSILSKDELKFVLTKPIGNDPKLRGSFSNSTQFYRMIPEWSRQIDENRKISASLGAGANNILVNVGTSYFNLKSNQITNRVDYEQQLSPLWKSNLGLDNNYVSYNADVNVASAYQSGGVTNPLSTGDSRSTVVSGEAYSLGAYWKNEVKLNESSQWTYLPGLRHDYYSYTKENILQPRLGARYEIDPSLQLKLMTGYYYQPPSAEQSDITYGNPDLKSQRATHWAVGVEKTIPGEDLQNTVSSTLFYKKLEKLIVTSSSYTQRNGQTVAENYNNNGTGYVYGLEFQSKIKKDQWGLTGSYTYSRSRRQQPGQSEAPSPYDQTHSLSLLFSFERGVWEYGTRFRYVTGSPYTPIVGAYYDGDNDVYVPQRGDYYSQRNKDFFQLDLRMDRKWVYDTWILSFYVDIQNLTNRKNQEGLTYSYDYSQKNEITGLPILPTVGVKGEF